MELEQVGTQPESVQKPSLTPYLTPVDAINRVPTKMNSVGRELLAPLPEFGEGLGVGSETAGVINRVSTKVELGYAARSLIL